MTELVPLKRITVQMLIVIAVLLRGGDWFGLRIARETGLRLATVYVILSRLEQAGWVTSVMEDPDAPDVERRPGPPRKYYLLTAHGKERGKAALQAREEAVARTQRQASVVPRASFET